MQSRELMNAKIFAQKKNNSKEKWASAECVKTQNRLASHPPSRVLREQQLG